VLGDRTFQLGSERVLRGHPAIGRRGHAREPGVDDLGAVDRVVDAAANDRVDDAGRWPREVRAEMEVQRIEQNALAEEHLIPRSLPPISHLERLLEGDAEGKDDVDSAGENRGDHGVRVAEKSDEYLVQGRAPQVVVAEAGKLEVRAGLPADEAIGAQADELRAESRARHEIRLIALVQVFEEVLWEGRQA